MTRPNQGLSSLTPGGDKMRDPGNEVVIKGQLRAWEENIIYKHDFEYTCNMYSCNFELVIISKTTSNSPFPSS